ncbi:MAG: ATP-binding cassette domain-containing protein [Candidatus Methanomethylicaceae archaeon]
MVNILITKNLKKYFGDIHAVDEVNITIKEGEFDAIVGPNGAGKTTLINLLSGMIKPDDGKVFFYERDITGMPPHLLAKIGLARSFQLVQIFENLTVLDAIRSAILSRTGKLKRIFSLLEKDVDVKNEALNILEHMGLLEKSHLLVRELAHGERKLLDVAISLALKPKLLLLDEPTSGVSIYEKDKIISILKSFVTKNEITTILVEHDMDIVTSYAERVLVMYEGKIVADGNPNIVLANSEVRKILFGGA